MYNAFISYSHTSDNKFAPALQSALQKFAKPWYKKRNLEIFRDESSLSASPHLWENITKALDASEYFILLASPLSEDSPWVNKEVEYWLEHKSIDTILIALTEGEMIWDNENGTFLTPERNSLPPALDSQFKSEPFYIDLRQSKTIDDLSLDNPIFKKEILKLAARLHNKTPNDLASEEVTVHRKMILIRNGVIAILMLLLGLSIFQTWEAKRQNKIAQEQTKFAQDQKIIAEEQTEIAKDSSNAAQIQREIAECQTQVAIDSANAAQEQRKIAFKERNIAQANYYISEAQREPDSRIAILLAKEAVKLDNSIPVLQIASELYRKRNYAKAILLGHNYSRQDSMAFLPGGKRFITYGIINDLGNDYAGTNVPTVTYIKNGKEESTYGSAYRVWDLKGNVLEVLSQKEKLSKYGDIFNNDSKQKGFKLYRDAMNIYLIDKNNKVTKTINYEPYSEKIMDIKLLENQNKILAVCNDGIICIWDIPSSILNEYDPLASYFWTTHGVHYDESKTSIASISDDGALLLASISGEVLLWDLHYGGLVNSFNFENSSVDCIQFDPSSDHLIYSIDSRYFRRNIINGTSELLQSTIETSCDYSMPNLLYVDYSPGYYQNSLDSDPDYNINESEQNWIYLTSKDGTFVADFYPDNPDAICFTKEEILVSSLDSLRLYKKRKSNKQLTPYITLNNVERDVNSLLILSPNKKFLLTFGRKYVDPMKVYVEEQIKKDDFILGLWDLKARALIKTYSIPINDEDIYHAVENDQAVPLKIEFSPDSKYLLIATNSVATIWDCPESLSDFFKSKRLNELSEERQKRRIIAIHD